MAAVSHGTCAGMRISGVVYFRPVHLPARTENFISPAELAHMGVRQGSRPMVDGPGTRIGQEQRPRLRAPMPTRAVPGGPAEPLAQLSRQAG